MSYAVRNTIILLVTLALFIGGAYSYIKFVQVAKIDDLEATYSAKQSDLNSKRATSDAFPELNQKYLQAVSIIENYDKSLFQSPDPEAVYDYLSYLSNSSTNSQVFFDYTFNDSTRREKYGIINSTIIGYGAYSNVVNFINKLENSQLLNKVTFLSVLPVSRNSEELNDVTFNLRIASYYERLPIQKNAPDMRNLSMDGTISTFNPFYPIIQYTLPPNDENLINVEQSRLIGLTGNRIFIVDQGGNIHALRKGDKVYLGVLESMDINKKTATFNLNKGGIKEIVTLEIER